MRSFFFSSAYTLRSSVSGTPSHRRAAVTGISHRLISDRFAPVNPRYVLSYTRKKNRLYIRVKIPGDGCPSGGSAYIRSNPVRATSDNGSPTHAVIQSITRHRPSQTMMFSGDVPSTNASIRSPEKGRRRRRSAFRVNRSTNGRYRCL